MFDSIQIWLGFSFERYGHGFWYFAGGAALFLLVGFAFGYFVWRRGLMQVVELESENKQSADTIEILRTELQQEKKRIDVEHPDELVVPPEK